MECKDWRGGGNDEKGWNVNRRSKDKKVNSEGRELIKFVREIGGNILNGVINGRQGGRVCRPEKQLGNGLYCNHNCYEIVNNFKVANWVDSDHMPTIMTTTAGAAGIKEDLGEEVTGNVRKYETCWSRNDIRQYTERTNDKQWEEREYGNSIEEM